MRGVHCSDWHRGWGYGGHDKIGRLSYNPETSEFTWKGHSQGRHGRTWNHNTTTVFKLGDNDEIIFVSDTTILPDLRDVRESIRILMTPNIPKLKHRKIKNEQLDNQLSLFN